MPINVISDAPHVPRCVLRTADADAKPVPPDALVAQPQTVVTEVTTENWDIVHWPKLRYEIVDALVPFPDALAAFLVVIESFRARALNGMPVESKIGENGGPPQHVFG